MKNGNRRPCKHWYIDILSTASTVSVYLNIIIVNPCNIAASSTAWKFGLQVCRQYIGLLQLFLCAGNQLTFKCVPFITVVLQVIRNITGKPAVTLFESEFLRHNISALCLIVREIRSHCYYCYDWHCGPVAPSQCKAYVAPPTQPASCNNNYKMIRIIVSRSFAVCFVLRKPCHTMHYLFIRYLV